STMRAAPSPNGRKISTQRGRIPRSDTSPRRPLLAPSPQPAPYEVTETALIPENWSVRKWRFTAITSRLGGAEDDEDIQVFRRAEGVHSEAGGERDSGGGDLPPGRYQPGDLFQ